MPSASDASASRIVTRTLNVRVAGSTAGEISRTRAGTQAFGLRPQRHHQLLRRLQFVQAILRHADRHLALAGARHAHHRLPRGDHLPRLGRHRGDHAGLRRDQRSVAQLVARNGEIRLRLFVLRTVGIERVALGIQRRRTDEFFPMQILVALVLRLREPELGLGGRDLRLRGLGLQADVRRIQARQHLALVDARADIDFAGDEFPGDAEREIGLVPRPHLAGEHRRRSSVRREPVRA